MQLFIRFFSENPTLYYAFAAAIGSLALIHNCPAFLIFLFPFCLFHLRKGIYGILLSASFFLFTFSFPQLPESGVIGKAHIIIDQLIFKKGPYRPSWIYKGRIHHFTDGTLTIKNVPFFLSLPEGKKNRPLASCDYEIICSLKKGKGNQVILRPLPKLEWKALNQFSLSEWRFSLKQKIKEWMKGQFSSEATIHFLSGLLIGEFDDNDLRKDFERFGLLHLLAISGFHFNILATLLSLLLRPFFQTRYVVALLLILLSLYFLFLGWGPSIVRAWLTLLFYLGGYFHKRFSSPINLLGVAILLSLMIDPFLIENLGYQFSVLSTGAILMGLNPFLELLHQFFPKRPLKTVLEWQKNDQFLYLTLGFIKNGIAMTIVTTCIALPMGLYYFEKFPLFSLFYNLFFPFLVSISMSLLLLGSLFFLIPPLAVPIHHFNDYFTSFILNMTYEIPGSGNCYIFLSKPQSIYIIIYIIALFILSIYLQKYKKQLKYKAY